MSYYVAKKNRCPTCADCSPSSSNCISPFLLSFAITSSKQNDIVSSKQVYKTETQQDSNPLVVQQKGIGNTKKRGSGGNSYASYLAKKRGEYYVCDC
jgi:hypothetical protein